MNLLKNLMLYRSVVQVSRLCLFVFLVPLQVLAQDITGIWTGHLQAGATILPFELAINQDLTGYSYTIFVKDGVENTGIKSITCKQKNGKITFSDNVLIYNNFSTPSRHIKMSAVCVVKTEDSMMSMTGTFETKTLDFRSQDNYSYTGSLSLQKQSPSAKTKLIVKLGELDLWNTLSFFQQPMNNSGSAKAAESIDKNRLAGIAKTSPDNKQSLSVSGPSGSAGASLKEPVAIVKAAADIATRTTEILRSISFSTDSLVLTLYDNGIVDGDTVSVVLNGNVIIPRLGLSEKPFRLVVRMTPDLGDTLQMVMYAENLGSIPPNTGLLILEDGENRHEIRFEGDLQKSSAVKLIRKKIN
jgi:hypothetical protein